MAPTTIHGPAQCDADSDCPVGQLCTSEFSDTQICSPKCDFDGGGCPVGYRCQLFAP